MNIAAWAVPVALSALFLGLYDVTKKDAVNGNAVFPVLALSSFSGTILVMILASVQGEVFLFFKATRKETLLIAGKSLLVGASWICNYYAVRQLPISISSPIRSTSPVWTVLGGILIYREIPTLFQSFGIIIVFCGYFLFTMAGKREGFSWKSKAMLLIVTGTILGACSGLYDKYLLGICKIDRQMLMLHFSVGLSVIFSLTAGIQRLTGNAEPFRWKWTISATGILLIGADYLYFYALGLPDTPISMVALIRRCNCIVAFLLGAKIFHDANLRVKAIGLLILLIGAAFIVLAK